MPSSCSAYGCRNRSKKESSISFHRFPLKKPDELKLWINATRRKDFKPNVGSFLCSVHFTDKDFQIRPGAERRMLRDSAVPSIFSDEFPPKVKLKRKKPCRTTRSLQEEIQAVSLPSPIATEEDPLRDSPSPSPVTTPRDSPSPETAPKDSPSQVTAPRDSPSLVTAPRDSTYPVTSPRDSPSPVTAPRDSPSPVTSPRGKRKLKEENNIKYAKKIKCLKQKVRRQSTKIITLKGLIRSLKSRGLLDEEFSGNGISASHLFKNLLKNQKIKNPRAHRYSEDVKKFSLTLYKNSPKAYRFCRQILYLPSPVSLMSMSNWNSNAEAQPGFLKHVFQKLKALTDDMKDCNLILDIMPIRSEIIWDPSAQKFMGFCDFGAESLAPTSTTDDEPATEALFFMLVSLKHQWNSPIGYFLQNKSNAQIQSNLIKTALQLSKNVGLRVHGITFDGTATNFETAQILGCNVLGNYDILKSNFSFEFDDYYVIPNVSHMIKLARNCLASLGALKSPDGIIEWRYITNLYELQSSIGLKFANKLSKNHIDWQKNKMKIKFATETLSSSIADALEYLMNQRVAEFEGAEATIKCIRNLDKLFNMLKSSKIPSAKDGGDGGYKAPIFANNLNNIEKETTKIIQYIFNLKNYYTSEDLFRTKEKTFLIGFALAVNSIVNISKKLIFATGKFKLVLANRFSKDYLELFLSKIRSQHENSTNPNVGQLKSSVKEILLHKDIVGYSAANCEDDNPLPSGSKIFEFKERKKQKQTVSIENIVIKGDEENYFNEDEGADTNLETDFSLEDNNNNVCTILINNILYYICSDIVQKIIPKIDCLTCRKSLLKEPSEHNYAHVGQYATFLDFKMHGALTCRATENCLKIVKVADQILTLYTKDFTILSGVNDKLMDRIIMKVLNVFVKVDDSLLDLCNKLEVEGNILRCHKFKLIKLVTKYYLDVKLFVLGELRTENMNQIFSKR